MIASKLVVTKWSKFALIFSEKSSYPENIQQVIFVILFICGILIRLTSGDQGASVVVFKPAVWGSTTAISNGLLICLKLVSW